MAEAINGKWKIVSAEGDFEGFLEARGVPMLVRKALSMLNSSGGKFTFDVSDNTFKEIEHGMMSDTKFPPIPMDGVTAIDDKDPAGAEVSKTCSFTDGVLKVTITTKSDPEDIVTSELKVDGNEMKRTFVTVKTGHSFTSTLTKV